MSESLPGVPVDLPLPPYLTECFGYRHDARFVSLRWSCDHLVYDDGSSSGTGNGWAFSAYARHRAVAPLLSGLDLGGCDHEAPDVLLIDRERNMASICPLREARAFLRSQHPPAGPPTPEGRAEAARRFDEMVDEGWTERPVDHAALARAMDEQRGRMGRLMAWLDMAPEAPESER